MKKMEIWFCRNIFLGTKTNKVYWVILFMQNHWMMLLYVNHWIYVILTSSTKRLISTVMIILKHLFYILIFLLYLFIYYGKKNYATKISFKIYFSGNGILLFILFFQFLYFNYFYSENISPFQNEYLLFSLNNINIKKIFSLKIVHIAKKWGFLFCLNIFPKKRDK